MRWDARGLALAVALATAVLWILCSAFVMLAPGPAMGVTGHMMHGDLTDFSWSLTWSGFLVGLVSWMILAAACAWLVAWTYNRLAGPTAP